MTKQEENKLIVEFMGLPVKDKEWFANRTKIEIINDDYETIHYDKDWYSLMLVIERIESLKCPINGRFGVYISSNTCTIQSIELFKSDRNDRYYSDSVLDTKIESTYSEIIKFIKWYNKNK